MFVDKENTFNCVRDLIGAHVISEIFFDKKVFELLHWRFVNHFSDIDLLSNIVYIFRNKLSIRVLFLSMFAICYDLESLALPAPQSVYYHPE